MDTVQTRIDAWLEALKEEDIAAETDHVRALIGADGKKLAREIAERAGRRLSDDDAERIDKRSGEIYDELNKQPQPTAGAHALLMALEKSDLKWAIATSSRAQQTKTSIKALNLPAAPLIVDGSHVEHAKPAPDLLLEAARQLKSKERDCWYVGDSTWDMLASKAAGMVSVAVAYGAATASELREAGADVVTTLSALLSELQSQGII